ncbi:MAG: hypothetical protein WCY08_16205 [Rhodocyclaceae bacterium]
MSARILFALSAMLFCASALALDVFMSVAVDGDGRPVVSGKTNLPDSTALMVSISGEQSRLKQQSKAIVRRGNFQAGPFTNRGQPLADGEYTFSISTPVASLLPKEVQAVIGSQGERLSGPLVAHIPGGKLIKYTGQFTVGGSQGSMGPHAINAVKASSCKTGGTVEQCLDRKTAAPDVHDYGWSARRDGGGYVVEKRVHVGGLSAPTTYRWSVSDRWAVRPLNGHAISLSR